MTLSLFVCKKKRLKLDLKEADVYCGKEAGTNTCGSRFVHSD